MNNETLTNTLPQKKTHPLLSDWKSKCHGNLSNKDLKVKIAFNVMATIEDFKFEPSPPIPDDVRNFMSMSQKNQNSLSLKQLENLKFRRDMWWNENQRRWAKNKANLQFLFEQKKILEGNGFLEESEYFNFYIETFRENNIKTFKEHSCEVCKNEFQEDNLLL